VKRSRLVLERAQELLKKATQGDGLTGPDHLLSFFSAFGMAGVSDDYRARGERKKLLSAGVDERTTRLFKKVVERVDEVLTWSLRGKEKDLDQARMACPYVGIDVDALLLTVTDDVPEPKSWEKLQAQKVSKAQAADSKKAGTKKKKGAGSSSKRSKSPNRPKKKTLTAVHEASAPSAQSVPTKGKGGKRSKKKTARSKGAKTSAAMRAKKWSGSK